MSSAAIAGVPIIEPAPAAAAADASHPSISLLFICHPPSIEWRLVVARLVQIEAAQCHY
jgi:hypothetical protein